MKRFKHLTRGRRWCAGVGLLIASVLPGCYDKCNTCDSCDDGEIGGRVHRKCGKGDIPPGAIPVLTGTYTRAIRDYQESLAEQDDFVIYEHEWYLPGGTKPGPYGRYHLAQILKRLPEVPFPVLIQAHPDDGINEARRLLVSQFLQTNGILDADTRVVIGFPEAGGLYGSEAIGAFRVGFDPRYSIFSQYNVGNYYGSFANSAFRGIGAGFGSLRR